MSQPYLTPGSDDFHTLWTAQSGLCALCKKPMLRNRFEAPHARVWAKQRATFDHIIPRSKGGSDAAANLQLAHARCNRIKGNKL
ncbi:MAG: HNH endonuclease [Hyphomonas sp.]|nr:HNH endonuclease [Hyphomonas sp.]